MDKILLRNLRRQDKYTKFFKEWQEQEFKDHPNESKVLHDLEVLSASIGMREGFVIACFDYRNLSLAFFTGNVEEITGYPESIFKVKGMEASFSLVHPDDRIELFKFQKIVFEVFYQLTIPERHTFEFSYTTRWVHRITNEVMWVVGKAKPFFIDSDGNFAIDLHIILQMHNPPKVTSYDWNYSYQKADGTRVYVTKASPVDHFVKLTKKEKILAHMILDGKESKEIGEELNISVNTVGTHRKNILKKLNARNMGEMIKILASYDF
jgi:DNA-binding CsgD family transcriptional regulator